MSIRCTSDSDGLHWAGHVSNANTSDPMDALGRPDHELSYFVDYNAQTIETATYAGFGTGDVSPLDRAALAELLHVSEAILDRADFLIFEANGLPNYSVETSDWIFSDGVHSLTVSQVFGAPPAGAIVASGNVANPVYAAFFEFTQVRTKGDMPYLLIDIDGASNVNPFSPNFSVRVESRGTGPGVNDSTEPDAMAVIGKGLSDECGATGSATVTFIATDPTGNSNSCMATFTIEDTVPPAIVCPGDLTIECGARSQPARTGAATATDLCGPNVLVGYQDVSVGSCPTILRR
ncbi:MAG: hypothetical protein AAF492_27800, partial [Verrucomicrobiota bacterium]